MTRSSCSLLGAALLAVTAVHAQVVDGAFDEWETPLYTDVAGDAGPVDLGRFWATGDADYFYLAFEVGTEINLQSDDVVTLYVDTDSDAATGEAIAGIGADVRYALGLRTGQVTLPGQPPATVGHAALGLFSSPTVTSDRFEVALWRGATVGGRPVFPEAEVRVVLVAGGDALPDEPGGVGVTLDGGPRERPAVDLDRRPYGIRVLSYNVLRGRITDPTYRAPFERIFRALQPDVVALQEVFDSSTTMVAVLEEFLPGTTWYGAGLPGTDAMVLSQYSVLRVEPLCEREGSPGSCNVAALLDLGGGGRLYVVSMHPPCCANDVGRQAEFDLLAAHLRDGRASGAIPADAPVIVAGDMNLVGDRRQAETLLTGAIVDTDRFGPGAPPDVDGTALADASPRTTGQPGVFTWVNAASSFAPGRLDYIVYSDALLEAAHGFALYTPALTPDERARYGLEADDSDVSDHLPLVQDVAFRPPTSVTAPPEAGMTLDLAGPNPSRTTLTVRYRLDRPDAVRLTVTDPLGRTVLTLKDGAQNSGRATAQVDVRSLAPGTYGVRLVTASGAATRTFTVVR